MALIQDFETPTGAVASYWRLTDVRLTPSGITAMLDGYLDEAARRAGRRPAHSVSFDMPFKDSLNMREVYAAAMAAYIEGRALFADAKSA